MKNLYLPNIGNDYYVSIARELIKYDFKIKVVGFGEDKIYQSDSLTSFIQEINPKIITWEDTGRIDRFDKIFDPDYSLFSIEYFSKIHYFEKTFLMSLDRNLFDPISQIERIRIFHKFLAHAYKLMINEKIDGILMFGTPHGSWSIVLCAVAEILGIELRYTDFGLIPELSSIETNINIRKEYSQNEYLLGELVNSKESDQIKEIIKESISSPLPWSYKTTNTIQKSIRVIKRIVGLTIFKPLTKYYSTEFLFNRSSRFGFIYIFKYFKYLYEIIKALNFYEKKAIKKIPESNSLVIFFHKQPEASTLPMGYIYADQLLMLEIILNSLPKDIKIYIKEHPDMFTTPAQDRHERSEYFYKELLRDKRVKFIDKSVSSNLIINNAKYICSTCGSVSWEALKLGKACIIFGWAWFSDCDSCYSVDSAASFAEAIDKINKTNKTKVNKDVKQFIGMLEKRLIYGAADINALQYLKKDYRYNDGIKNLSKAIKESFKNSYKSQK